MWSSTVNVLDTVPNTHDVREQNTVGNLLSCPVPRPPTGTVDGTYLGRNRETKTPPTGLVPDCRDRQTRIWDDRLLPVLHRCRLVVLRSSGRSGGTLLVVSLEDPTNRPLGRVGIQRPNKGGPPLELSVNQINIAENRFCEFYLCQTERLCRKIICVVENQSRNTITSTSSQTHI